MATTWNPSDKSPAIALSNGNLTYKGGGTTGNQGVRATSARNSGKFYIEFTDVSFPQGDSGVGICTLDSTFANLGASATVGVITYRSGNVYLNGSSTYLSLGTVSGHTVCMAIDLDNGRVWFRLDGGAWLGTATGADPESNINGFSLAGFFTSSVTDLYPVGLVGTFGSTDTATANFGASAFVQTPPVGVVAWDASALPPLELSADFIDESAVTIEWAPPAAASEPHNYWRVYIESNNGDGYTSVGELYMRAAIAGDDVCTGGMIIASGVDGDNYAEYAFDRADTRWQVFGDSDIWIGYHFPARVEIVEFGLEMQTPWLEQAPKAFRLEYSDDGATWHSAFEGARNETGWNNYEPRFYSAPTPALELAATFTDEATLDAVLVPPRAPFDLAAAFVDEAALGAIITLLPLALHLSADLVDEATLAAAITVQPPNVESPTTFNPADKSAHVVLSNGNLTVSSDVNELWGGVRAFGGKIAGKWYFEVDCTHVYGTWTGAGIATASANLDNLPTLAAGGVMVDFAANIYINGTNTGIDLGTMQYGDVLCVATDLDRGRIWFKLNDGNWNANAAADPENNVGGADLTGLVTPGVTPVHPVATAGYTQDELTANFGASAFAFAPSTGFARGWSTAGVVAPLNLAASFVDESAFTSTLTMTSLIPPPIQLVAVLAW